MKHTIRKLFQIIMLVSFIILSSCEKDLYENQIEQSRVKTVNLDDLPMLKSAIASKRSTQKITGKNIIDYLGLIQPNGIKLVVNKEGVKFYTCALNIEEYQKLTNLLIEERDGMFDYKLIEYKSNNFDEWKENAALKKWFDIIPDVSVKDLDGRLFNFGYDPCIHVNGICPSGLHLCIDSDVDMSCNYPLDEWFYITTFVPCYGLPEGADGSGSSTGSSGNSGSSGVGGIHGSGSGIPHHNNEIITEPVLIDVSLLKKPCEQLKDNNSKPIANSSPPKTLLDNLNDLNSQMASIPRERFFALTPTSTEENEFVEDPKVGPLNGGEVSYSANLNVISAFMHCHYSTTLLSIFSLSDLYQMQYYADTGNITNKATFTSYLVTAHGTKYAIKFTPTNTLNPYNAFFFTGWDFDNIKEIREKKYEQFVKQSNSVAQNELGFLKFAKDQNLGIEIYKADDTFSQWSKLSIDSNGEVKSTPCN